MGEDYEWMRYTFDTHNKAGFPLCTWQTFPWLAHDGAWKRIFDVKNSNMAREKAKLAPFRKLDLIKTVEFDNSNRSFTIFIGDITVFISFISRYKRDRG